MVKDRLRSIRHWIFDFDGTITLPQHDFAAIKQHLEIPMESDILTAINAMPPERHTSATRYLETLEHQLAHEVEAADGVLELLNHLHQQDYQLAIITRNLSHHAYTALSHLALLQHFDPVIGRHDAPPKPDPGGIQTICRQWNVEASNVVMIGDYKYDLIAGRNAGAFTIHYAEDSEQRWPEWTDLTIHHYSELTKLLFPETQ